MPIWNPNADSVLLQAVKDYGDSWDAVGLAVTQAGRPTTGDAARLRYKRLQRVQDVALEDRVAPPQAVGDYVGFDIAFFDLETTSLGAWTGDLVCASIVDNWGVAREANRFQFDQTEDIDDSGLATWVRDNLEQFDILVAWNGFGFDISFLNAKLIEHGERPLRDMMAIDPMYKVRQGRYGLKAGSSKLGNAGKWLSTPNQKPEVSPKEWRRADHLDMRAVQELQERCTLDCLVMRDIFHRIKPMVRSIHR